MIVIVDDTFRERHKFNNVEYLKEDQYLMTCKIFSIVKTTEMAQIVTLLPNCDVFCNHKTLQLFNNKSEPLSLNDNNAYREVLLNKVVQSSVQRIEFSRGLETNFEANKIDKDLFYTNLKPFLDYYIKTNIAETKILFWGEAFREKERLTAIQNMLVQIRMVSVNEFEHNPAIKKGLNVLYPNMEIKSIVNNWIERHLSKNDIINQINNLL